MTVMVTTGHFSDGGVQTVQAGDGDGAHIFKFQAAHKNLLSNQQTDLSKPNRSNKALLTTMRTKQLRHSSEIGTRIPRTLQSVFLASNRGKEVHTPPPQGTAFKVFRGGLFGRNKQTARNQEASVQKKEKTRPASEEFICESQSPQDFLDKELEARGYSIQRFTTINSGYSNMPSLLQLASYDVHILKMIVRDKDEEALREILSCGISPNACNKYGESLLHKVCKSGLAKILQVFLESGADVQISDGAGRTLLHNACWGAKPSYKTFEMILNGDIRLLHMMDGGGATPLTYVRKQHYGAWVEYLTGILDVFWPPRDPAAPAQGPPPLALEKACSRPVQNPKNSLSLELTAMVAAGRMEPAEAIAVQYGDDIPAEDDDECDVNFDEREMDDLIQIMNVKVGAAA